MDFDSKAALAHYLLNRCLAHADGPYERAAAAIYAATAAEELWARHAKAH